MELFPLAGAACGPRSSPTQLHGAVREALMELMGPGIMFVVVAVCVYVAIRRFGKPRTLETAIRSDARVRRLLRNKSWAPTAEAAIAHFVHGRPCALARWEKTTTWQIVEMVFGEKRSSYAE